MCICGCGSAKSHRKLADLRLRNTSCSFAEFAVAELSVNLRCPALRIRQPRILGKREIFFAESTEEKDF